MKQDYDSIKGLRAWKKRVAAGTVIILGAALTASGAQAATCGGGFSGNYCVDGSTMTPGDASFIDSKVDDGIPKSGRVVSVINNITTLPGRFHSIAGCDVGTGTPSEGTAYELSASKRHKPACALSFQTAF